MHTEEVKETHKEPKTISIKLPQLKLPSLQAAILILLIAVGYSKPFSSTGSIFKLPQVKLIRFPHLASQHLVAQQGRQPHRFRRW